jgi:hypothetical protein
MSNLEYETYKNSIDPRYKPLNFDAWQKSKNNGIDYTTRSEPKKQPAKWIQWIKKNKQDILIVLIVFLIIAFIITMFLWSYGVFSIGVSGL